jgi:hypothetical protein
VPPACTCGERWLSSTQVRPSGVTAHGKRPAAPLGPQCRPPGQG